MKVEQEKKQHEEGLGWYENHDRLQKKSSVQQRSPLVTSSTRFDRPASAATACPIINFHIISAGLLQVYFKFLPVSASHFWLSTNAPEFCFKAVSQVQKANSHHTHFTLLGFIRFRIHFKVLVFTYKVLHGQYPEYICDLIHAYITSRSLRTSGQGLLAVLCSRLKTKGGCGFEVVAPTL